MPSKEITLETTEGTYYFFKADILKGLITYSTDKNFMANAVTITARNAFEIINMNKRGEKPTNLIDVNSHSDKPIDLVEQESLTRFDKRKSTNNRKKKKKTSNKSEEKQAANKENITNTEKGRNRNHNKKNHGANNDKQSENPSENRTKNHPKEKTSSNKRNTVTVLFMSKVNFFYFYSFLSNAPDLMELKK